MPRDGLGRNLGGKRILITGGGTGIGASTAMLAAAAGMKVMVTGRRENVLDAVVERIRSAGGEAIKHVGDVTGEGASDSTLDRIRSEWGGVDAVFANAGYGIEKPVLESDDDDLRRIYEINVFAAVDLLRRSGRMMLEDGRPGHARASWGSSPCPATVSTRRPRRHSPMSVDRCEWSWRGAGSPSPASIR